MGLVMKKYPYIPYSNPFTARHSLPIIAKRSAQGAFKNEYYKTINNREKLMFVWKRKWEGLVLLQ